MLKKLIRRYNILKGENRMKKINKEVFVSFDKRGYDTEEECKIADINEMLHRFIENEGYNGMTKNDIGDLLSEHKETLQDILNGEAIYKTNEELGINN
jgi:hypothetical protein